MSFVNTETLNGNLIVQGTIISSNNQIDAGSGRLTTSFVPASANDVINLTYFNAHSSSISGSGTASYNAYWTGTTTLGSEQYVASSRGGIGADLSGTAGLIKGSGTVGTYTNALLVNADVSSGAGIARNKLATGGANNFVYDDGSGNLTDSNLIQNSSGNISMNPTTSLIVNSKSVWLDGVGKDE